MSPELEQALLKKLVKDEEKVPRYALLAAAAVALFLLAEWWEQQAENPRAMNEIKSQVDANSRSLRDLEGAASKLTVLDERTKTMASNLLELRGETKDRYRKQDASRDNAAQDEDIKRNRARVVALEDTQDDLTRRVRTIELELAKTENLK